jgi:anti-anti-sigma regulatory factor
VRTNDLPSPQDSTDIKAAAGGRPGRFGVPGDGRLRITWKARLVLAGDIDLTSHAALITALTRARAADSSGRVHIDMAAVRFCDVAGMRIILGGGDGPQPPSARTTVHNLRPRLRKLRDLLTEAPAPDHRGASNHRRCAGD